MIGVILAAGKGSRLGRLTDFTPKSLLELNNDKTLLDYNLEVLTRLGVSQILIVTGFQSEKIENHVKGLENVKCIYNPFWNLCNVLGSLYMVFPYIKDDFLFLHADTIVDYTVWQRLKETEARFVLPYKQKKCGEEEMKVTLHPNGKLMKITKDMDAEDANGEFLGIAKFSRNELDYMSNTSRKLLSKNLHLYMESVLESAIEDQKDIVVFDIGDSNFVEVDFEVDLILAREIFS